MVTTDLLNIRSKPSSSGAIVGKLVQGDVTNIIGTSGDWYKIEFGGNTGYIYSAYVSTEKNAETSRANSPRGREAAPVALQMVDFAKKYVGTPYRVGGATPKGFDCSGLTSFVYNNFGYNLPHSSSAQTGYGVKVSKDNLQPGDLLFFSYYGSKDIDHVGIYIGGGQFIHSTKPGYTVKISSLETYYYEANYITARRIVE